MQKQTKYLERINFRGIPKPNFETLKQLQSQHLSEFKEMCIYHQTNPESHFTQKRLISLPTINGRITISGDQLKIKEKELTKERTITENEFSDLLIKYFNFVTID